MALDEPNEGEESLSINGINVVFSEHVKDLVDATTIDYVRQTEGEGFVMIGQESGCC